jgi:UPF0755 protein
LRRSLLNFVGATAVFVIACLAAAGIWLRAELAEPYYRAKAAEAFIDIPRGAGTTETANRLADAGILHRRLPFMIYLRYTNLGRRIQAGEYRFSQAATPRQIAQRLVRGDVYFRSVTVPEGLTAQETVELLAKNGLGNLAEMQQILLKTDWIADLDPAAKNLEGYLFPETYRFGRKVDSEAVLKTMVRQFRVKLAKILASYPLPAGWNVAQIVILASMIEKEVKRPEEGPLVASVLVNRLERGIPLACDATIIYAMKSARTYEGRLRKADLARESPYNSYLHLKLPPGPISNPGSGSLRAALSPAKTDYFYYVSRNDGTHEFSKDLRAHLHAVDRFQKPIAWRKSRN